jgi:hypothetical protein
MIPMIKKHVLMAAVACLTLPAAVAVSAPGASAAPRQSGQLTPAQLRSRLITLGQLPRGTQPYQVAFNDLPNESNKPACLNTLNAMDSPTAPRSVTQAQAAFTESEAEGPWILETLRSYPGQGAVRAFSTDTATLAGCRTFTLNWSTPQQPSIETVDPHGSLGVGNQSWTATITVAYAVTGYGITQYVVQYFIRVGDSILNLEINQSISPMTIAQYKSLATTAVSRLAG